MKKAVNYFVTNSDFYSKSINFRFKDKDRSTTMLGGILSILTAISMIYFTIFFGREIWEKKIPIVRFNREYNNHTLINLTKMPIIINVFNYSTQPIENFERTLYIKATFWDTLLDPATGMQYTTLSEVPVMKCQDKNFSMYSDLINNPKSGIPLSTSYCLGDSSVDNYTG